jgi:2'-5' RNA ligase
MSQGPSEQTYGICSVLTGEAASATQALWDHLERHHGLRAVKAAIHPHLSYVVGECSRPGALAAALADAAPGMAPLTVDVDGAGVFDGPQPVVFLRVVKGPALVDAHARIMEATQDRWERVWPHYFSDTWCPHITLALGDIAPESLSTVIADLRGRVTRFMTRLDSLDLAHVVRPRHDYLGRWGLGGQSRPWRGIGGT